MSLATASLAVLVAAGAFAQAQAGSTKPLVPTTLNLNDAASVYNWTPLRYSLAGTRPEPAPRQGPPAVLNVPTDVCPSAAAEETFAVRMRLFYLPHRHRPNSPVRASVTLGLRPFLVGKPAPACAEAFQSDFSLWPR